MEFLKDLQAVKQLGNILKTNVRACKALGHPYVHQLGKIYLDMLNVYKVSMCFIRGMHKLVWLVIEDHLENRFASLCIGHVGEHQIGHFLARGERDEAIVDPLDADGEEGNSETDFRLGQPIHGSHARRHQLHPPSPRSCSHRLPEEYTAGYLS